jgi:dCMP deaminase
MEQRKDWDTYFLEIARMIATRATCDRAHVGSVAVKDRNILATGYNGSIRGDVHCDEAGHFMKNNHCIRTVHSETNLICQAAKNGVSLNGATIYITHSPCWNCFKMIINSGIKEIVYTEQFTNDDFALISNKAKELGIPFRKHE